MTAKSATEELELIDIGGADGGPGPGGHGPGGGEPGPAMPALPQQVFLTGIWLALAAILMFFLALTSSFIVRKGISTDWVAFPWPRLLWWNTALLLVSSLTLERGRRLLAAGNHTLFRRWWGLTTALGLVFLVGQVIAWRQLAAAGVYLATNPSSSFFYVLTGTHGIHLLGGVGALLWVGFREQRENARASRRTAVTAASIYWHFLGGLWVFLFLLLLLGR